MYMKRVVCVYVHARGMGGGTIKFYLQCCFLFLYGSRCLLVFWGFFFKGLGETFRTVLTVAEGSITGALVGIHKVCCPGWCTLISLAWTSIL